MRPDPLRGQRPLQVGRLAVDPEAALAGGDERRRDVGEEILVAERQPPEQRLRRTAGAGADLDHPGGAAFGQQLAQGLGGHGIGRPPGQRQVAVERNEVETLPAWEPQAPAGRPGLRARPAAGRPRRGVVSGKGGGAGASAGSSVAARRRWACNAAGRAGVSVDLATRTNRRAMASSAQAARLPALWLAAMIGHLPPVGGATRRDRTKPARARPCRRYAVRPGWRSSASLARFRSISGPLQLAS